MRGAERLLIKEYTYLKENGYDVSIVCIDYNDFDLLSENILKEDLFKSGRGFGGYLRLLKYLKIRNFDHILCASGHIDLYLLSKLITFSYSLHLHHPIFMTNSDNDKYSLFKREYLSLSLLVMKIG